MATVAGWVAQSGWARFLAQETATRSCTSVCLRIVAPWFKALDAKAQALAAARLSAVLEAEGVALDAASYRDAPPGLRIWCGAPVEQGDVAALLPWLDQAFARVAGGGLGDDAWQTRVQSPHPKKAQI